MGQEECTLLCSGEKVNSIFFLLLDFFFYENNKNSRLGIRIKTIQNEYIQYSKTLFMLSSLSPNNFLSFKHK